MSTSTRNASIESTIRGRSFARTSPEGWLDGSGDHGIYSHDVRMIRRAESFGAGRAYPVLPTIAVDADGAVIRWVVPSVGAGEAVLLIAEVDGADVFQIRRGGGAVAPTAHGFKLDAPRNEARVQLEAWCDGAELEHRDGVAYATHAIPADGTPRTASWRWRRAADGPTAPMDVIIELRVAWSIDTDEKPPSPRSYDDLVSSHRVENNHWISQRPIVEGGSPELARVFERALDDLATLRIDGDEGVVLAAGAPWQLTLVGRSSLLAAWMALPVDPRIAVATLRHLAKTQSRAYNVGTDAEPGKIVHEERRGVAAERWHELYYGSVDATPLFVQLAEETWRWTGDDALALELEPAVRAAVDWILSRLEEDELGLLAFSRRAERGIDIQSWKDTSDAYRDGSGRVASGHLRPLEVQGYAIGALNAAAKFAQHAWEDVRAAEMWRGAAADLSRKVLAHYTVSATGRLDEDDPRGGGFLAGAVDENGTALDSLGSDGGRLLWAQAISDPAAAQRTARQLASQALWSGWGIRTMSTTDTGYSSRSEHCGSVWTHDTALSVAGMATIAPMLAGIVGEAVFAMADADGRLPVNVSGAARGGDDLVPERLDVACQPQSWTAASPFLIARALLGLEPSADGELESLTTEAPAFLRGLRWNGVHCLGRRWDVAVDDNGVVAVTPA